jgi:hypothetical protein
MMDRWLKTGSFTKSNEKLHEQSIASSTSVPDLEPIQGGDIESCSELPSCQTKSNEQIGEQSEKKRKETKIWRWLFTNGVLFHRGGVRT